MGHVSISFSPRLMFDKSPLYSLFTLLFSSFNGLLAFHIFFFLSHEVDLLLLSEKNNVTFYSVDQE